MYGTNKISKKKVQRPHKIVLNSVMDNFGENTFLPVFPREAVIKDILFYRPYETNENIIISFYRINDTGQDLLLRKDGLITNELHRVNLEVSGMIKCVVSTEDIKLVIFYV